MTTYRRKRSHVQRILRGTAPFPPGKFTRKRPLESSHHGAGMDPPSERTNDDAMDPVVTTPQDMTVTETNPSIPEQATTVSPVGATAGTANRILQQVEGGGNGEENDSKPRKRQRLDDPNDCSLHTADNVHTVRTRTKRRKQIEYYRKCHRDAPAPSVRSRALSIPPILPFLTQQQRQQQQRLAGSQIMAVAWLAKLGQEYQQSLVIQSPMYRFLQMQLQHALQQQAVQSKPIPGQREPNQQGHEQSQSSQATQSQPGKDIAQLQQECSMWQEQSDKLRIDFQRERTSKLALQQEHQKLLAKHKVLKFKYKRFYHAAAGNDKSQSPPTPATSNQKTSASETSQLVPRQLVDDYPSNKQEQKSVSNAHPQERPSNRMTTEYQNSREGEHDDAVAKMTKNLSSTPNDRNYKAFANSTASNRTLLSNNQIPKPDSIHPKEDSKQPRETDSISASSSMTPSNNKNHNEMPPPLAPASKKSNQPFIHKEETANDTPNCGDSHVDHLMGDRVLPVSSQASVQSSDATEWHQNTTTTSPQLTKENHNPNQTTETQATLASYTSAAPSVNLLADTEVPTKPPFASQASSSSVQPLEESATEIHHAPVLPPESTVESNKMERMTQENHDEKNQKGEEMEDDPVVDDSPSERIILSSMPPPPTTPTALSRNDLPMDSPPVQEASQTTFHNGRTNQARPKGTLDTHPTIIRTVPMRTLPTPPEGEGPTRPRRVTLSPHTKPIQLSPFVSSAQQPPSKTPAIQEKDADAANPPAAARKITTRYYTGFAPNLYRQQTARAEPTPAPDDVPSDQAVDNASNTVTRIFPGSCNVGRMPSKKPPVSSDGSRKAIATKSPAAMTSAPRKPMQQPWIQNKSYHDFLQDTPPSALRTTTTTRPKPKPYIRKTMGGGTANNGNKENQFRYEEVVRKKAERETLKAYDCPDCAAFFDQMERDGFRREDMQCSCRHKARYTPPETPPGFWNLSFVDEQRKPPVAETADQNENDDTAPLDI